MPLARGTAACGYTMLLSLFWAAGILTSTTIPNATTKSSGTNWLSGKMVVDVTQSAPVQVVGVLTGDVSGDWIGQGSVLTGVVAD